MNSGIYTGVSGLKAQMQALDILANNLANAQTTGFKEEKPFFTVMTTAMSGEGSKELHAAVNSHAVMSGSALNASAGSLQHTGSDLDIALVGNGFLTVEAPQGLRYTRNGHLMVRADGTLSTAEGFPVLGENGKIVLGPGKVEISDAGDIMVQRVRIDRLRLADFDGGMKREGNSLLTPAAGNPTPKAAEAKVQQGFLEQSNVNPLTAVVRMVEIMRQFEAIRKGVDLEMNEMTGKAIDRLGR